MQRRAGVVHPGIRLLGPRQLAEDQSRCAAGVAADHARTDDPANGRDRRPACDEPATAQTHVCPLEGRAAGGSANMTTPATRQLDALLAREYKHGFVTSVETDTLPRGLNEDVIRMISAKKHEPGFMLEWRLKAFRHWLTMIEPAWATVRHPPIDYQSISYYSAPKKDRPQSLDEVDPELLKMYEKLGVPLEERKMLAGVAVDAVFDSVSVGTTFKAKLAELGIIFCSFSEAVQEHPDLVQKYLGSVVPYTEHFFASLNSA